MIDRHHARILALQAMCQLEVLKEDFLVQLDEFLADEAPPPGAKDYAADLVRETWTRLDEIDRRMQAASENWKVARMAPIDRNILRLAVCELFHRPDLPTRIALDEAIELAKTFGSAESPAFVNGVLDAIWKKKDRETKRKKRKKAATE